MALACVHKGGTVGCTRPRVAHDGFLCFVQLHPHRRVDEPNSSLGQGAPFHFSYMLQDQGSSHSGVGHEVTFKRIA